MTAQGNSPDGNGQGQTSSETAPPQGLTSEWGRVDPDGTDTVRVHGRDATLVLWAPDYDGTNKAWVRFGESEDAIVGGSQVERD